MVITLQLSYNDMESDASSYASECYIIYLLICRYMYSTHSLTVMVIGTRLVSGSHFVGGGAGRGSTVGTSE